MVQFRPQAREIIAKVVYYGPPLGGKTTNLRTLYDGYPQDVRGELLVVPAGGDRTIFFDFLPVDAGTLRNMRMRVQLYTVPGQVHYNATRQVVLRGVDAIVFVADSQHELLRANRESWENLKENLALQGLNLAELPHVLQYNKRDLTDLLSVEDLDELLNEFNAPFYEAVANTGVGVEETLQGVVKLVARSLRDRFRVPPDVVPDVVEPAPPAAPRGVPGVPAAPPAPPRPPYRPPVPTFGVASRDVRLGEPAPGAGAPRAVESRPPAGAQIFEFAAPADAPLEIEPLAPEAVVPPAPPEAPAPEALGPAPEEFQPAPELLPPPLFASAPRGGDIFGGDAPVPGVTTKITIPPLPPPPLDAFSPLGDPFGASVAAQAGPDADVFVDVPPAPVAPPAAESLLGFGPDAPFESAPAAIAEVPESAAAEVAHLSAPPEPTVSEPEPAAAEPAVAFAAPEPTVPEPEPAAAEPEYAFAAPEPGFVEFAPEAFVEPAPEPAEPEPVLAEPESAPEEAESAAFAPVAPEGAPVAAPALTPEVTASLSDEAGHAIVQRIVPRALAQVGEVRELELEVPVPSVWTGGKRLTLQFRLTLIPEEEPHAE